MCSSDLSHFLFRPGDDSNSFLLMGDGRTMTLKEMKKYENLFNRVELLTLSACNTATQFPGANGREIDGFAELAQRLGSNSVMASLWSVSEGSTVPLMKGFYQNLVVKKMSKAEALQKVQLDLLQGKQIPMNFDFKGDEGASKGREMYDDVVVESRHLADYKGDTEKFPFAHPYYWAPFVLYGNWK